MSKVVELIESKGRLCAADGPELIAAAEEDEASGTAPPGATRLVKRGIGVLAQFERLEKRRLRLDRLKARLGALDTTA